MLKCFNSNEDCKFEIKINKDGDIEETCLVCLKTFLHKKENIKDYYLLTNFLNNKNQN